MNYVPRAQWVYKWIWLRKYSVWFLPLKKLDPVPKYVSAVFVLYNYGRYCLFLYKWRGTQKDQNKDVY